MNKTLIIIILFLLIIVGAFTCIYFNKVSDKESADIEAERIRDSAMVEYNKIQKRVEKDSIKIIKINVELADSKSLVKHHEEKIAVMKATNKVLLAQTKRATMLLSDAKADSAIRYRYREDPDSIPQKVLMELAELDQSRSMIAEYDSTLLSYQKVLAVHELKEQVLSSQVEDSREQVGLLFLSQSKDIELIGIKNKEIRKQKGLKWLGYGVAVLVSGLALSR